MEPERHAALVRFVDEEDWYLEDNIDPFGDGNRHARGFREEDQQA
jgi:hypothetical protein